MPFVIYNARIGVYRSMRFGETWSADIKEAAVFRTHTNTLNKITEHTKKWKRYSTEWVGYKSLPTALKCLDIWHDAEPVEIKFEPLSTK